MAKQITKRYSKEFGKKEKVLNYATQTYQLSRPNKVGAVMALIRECQPKTIEEWEKWYFENATTDGKAPSKPVTAKANFGNYSATERMKASFDDFTKNFGGQVFVVFSIDDKIKNEEVIEQIAQEIKRLTK